MKKAIFILSFITIFSILICGAIFYKPHEQYAKSFIVVDVDYQKDIVTLEDFNGLHFCFSGCEDWATGDICAAIMDNNGTEETILDDIILDTNYCGWIY